MKAQCVQVLDQSLKWEIGANLLNEQELSQNLDEISILAHGEMQAVLQSYLKALLITGSEPQVQGYNWMLASTSE